jgi:ABC-2 type transport system permease protein
MEVAVRSQMQYRASFIMQSIGHFVTTGVEFLGIWALFDRFGHVKGWSLSEVALLYGMINVSFAIAEAVGRGFDLFPGMVKRGDFDRILLRPRSTVLQIAGSEMSVMRIGRFTQGAVLIVWALSTLGTEWSVPKAILLPVSIASGACLFYGIFVVQATLAFWTTETLELFNTISYGGVETAQYPLPIYNKWFRRFFTFIVPLGCVNYLPSIAILERTDPIGTPVILQWIAPAIGVLFLIVALQVWRIGVRNYRSTGS